MTTNSEINIVIPIFNRRECLKTLIDSINRQRSLDNRFKIWFSIDHSPIQNEILDHLNEQKIIKYNFEIIVRNENFGLKKNTIDSINEIFQRTNSDFLVHLEDDLILSPYCFDFIIKMTNSEVISKPDIFGVSLYAQNKELNHHTNIKYSNNSQLYKTTYPSSLGAILKCSMWKKFVENLDESLCLKYGYNHIQIPKWINEWKSHSSWKKELAIFCETKKYYFVYPKVSLTAHLGKLGTHIDLENNSHLNGSLCFEEDCFKLNSNLEAFDLFFEPQCIVFNDVFPEEILNSLEIDLYGSKPISYHKKYWLTCKETKNVIYSYGFEIQKPSDNIIHNIKGDFFKLCLSTDLIKSKMHKQRMNYFNSNYNPQSIRFLMKYLITSVINRISS